MEAKTSEVADARQDDAAAQLSAMLTPIASGIAEMARHQSEAARHGSSEQTKRLHLQAAAADRVEQRQFWLFAVLLGAVLIVASGVIVASLWMGKDAIATHALTAVAGLVTGLGLNRARK